MKTSSSNFIQRFGWLVALVCLGQVLNAQNFQTIYPDRSAHFATTVINTDFYDGFVDRCEDYDQCLLGTRIDSIDANDPEIHYFPRYARGALSLTGTICGGPSWMGTKWIQKDFVEYYFNGQEDTITIFPLADVGDRWNLFDLQGGFIEGEVISIETDLVLGNVDLVKSIRLQAKDNQGNPMMHPMDDQLLLLSENYGFVSTFDFYHFPKDPSPKELLGMTNPNLGQSLLPTFELYNLEIGLERHIFRECQNSNDLSYTQTTSKTIILDSIHLNNNVTYVTERTSFSVFVQPMMNSSDTTYFKDTVDITLPISPTILDAQPFEWFLDLDPIGPVYLFIAQEDGRWKKILRSDLQIDFPCMELTTGNGGDIVFQACLGQTDRINPINGACLENLIYFKKGSEVWGTPFDFDAITSTSSIVDFERYFELAPNPFIDQFRLRSKSGRDLIHQYKLMDLYGRIIDQGHAGATPQMSIELPNLASGVYLFNWMDQKGRQFLTRLIKK